MTGVRYEMPAALGGVEVAVEEAKAGSRVAPPGMVWVDAKGYSLLMWLNDLEKVVPPLPEEPAALGHYLVGGTHFEKVSASQCDCIGPEVECWEMVKGGLRFGWTEVWRDHGGYDVAIAWLVPVQVVSLPWRINGVDGRTSGFTEVRVIAGMVQEGLGNQTVSQGVRLTPDEAEQKAAALIAAAHQARADQAVGGLS